jgi:monofunctional biosynthetic peptidoglycan transglycosylase
MLKKIFRFIWRTILIFFLLSIAVVIVFRFLPVPVTLLMVERCVQQKMDGKPMKLDKQWVPLDKISNNLQLAVVASEDQNFLWHHGFDFKAIEAAIKYNETQEGKKHPRIRGASTISQQCAKNTFLFPSRNFIRKGLEVYFTALIELLWTKQRIMEVYLNVIEMGKGIYGAEAASQYYFHKHAKYLTTTEASLIAAILPDPLKWSASTPNGYVAARSVAIRTQMQLFGGRLYYDMKPPKEVSFLP